MQTTFGALILMMMMIVIVIVIIIIIIIQFVPSVYIVIFSIMED
jgi:hypothetical protein